MVKVSRSVEYSSADTFSRICMAISSHLLSVDGSSRSTFSFFTVVVAEPDRVDALENESLLRTLGE